MDVLGPTYAEYPDDEREAVVAVHPRTEHFKEDILQAFYEGLKHKPRTTFGESCTLSGVSLTGSYTP